MTDRDEIAAAVRGLLTQRLRLDAGVALAPATPLDALGIDSAALLSFVIGLEERFAIDIPDDAITREHFATIGAVTDFVAGRLATP